MMVMDCRAESDQADAKVLEPLQIRADARVRSTLLRLFLAAAGAIAATPVNAAPQRPSKVYDAKTLYDTVSLRGGSFSADERRVLVTSDESGVFNVYSLTLETGAMDALTFSTDRAMSGLDYFPHDDRVLLTSDGNGDELNHLYVRELDGTVVDLTPGEGLRASFLGWSGDRSSFYVLTNERDARFMDVYRYAFPSARRSGVSGEYRRRLAFRNDAGFQPSGVSPNERWLVASKVKNNADDDLFLIDLTRWQPEPIRITPHEGEATHRFADFARDSATLYFTTDAGGEFQRVYSFGLADHRRRLVHQSDWDVNAYSFSESGRYLVIRTNEDASTRLSLVDTSDGAEVEVAGLPEGDITGATFSDSERLICLSIDGDRAPTNLFCHDLVSGRTTRLTRSLNPAVDREDLVESTVVRYPSFDGLKIPALLYLPLQASKDHKVPAVVLVHGGPGGQSRKGYRAEVQLLANHGYAVLAVNDRGSSGYGRTFYHLDDRRHGEDDLKDCVYGRRYLESLDTVDGSRVAIMGGSYGGYMVAAALTFAPREFDAGINIFGVTNWVRTLESIPSWWEAYREALYTELGDPEADRDRLHRISPLFHADRIERPLLVVQGANDPRVLQVESDELVAEARKNGAEVEYLLFDDEGHGFRKRENRIAAADAYLQFLDEHLHVEHDS